MNKLIVISGPTASGKTSTSIKLAKEISAKNIPVAIVNFDSLLFYQEITIGTAKPTISERENIRHELVDIVSINSPLNASDFVQMAKVKIDQLFKENFVVILVGGSAFYLRALLKGMYEAKTPDPLLRKKIEDLYQAEGITPFVEFLKAHDPESLQQLHINDHYRLQRAYEFYQITGTKISEQKKQLDEKSPYDFNEIVHDWNLLHFYLDLPKDQHQKIIEARTRKMIDDGLIEEVKQILNNGYPKNLKPLESIGYKETIDYLDQKYPTLEDCIERIVISTRQLAKSQRTFFKKIEPKIECNPLRDFPLISERTFKFLSID